YLQWPTPGCLHPPNVRVLRLRGLRRLGSVCEQKRNMKHLVLRCWWLVFLSVFVTACFSPQFQDGQIMCGPNDECPPGLECFGGVCRTENPGIDAANTFPLSITLGGNMMGTVTSSPPGIDCGADCSEQYTSGTMVTLTATPMTGSVFVGWSGAC